MNTIKKFYKNISVGGQLTVEEAEKIAAEKIYDVVYYVRSLEEGSARDDSDVYKGKVKYGCCEIGPDVIKSKNYGKCSEGVEDFGTLVGDAKNILVGCASGRRAAGFAGLYILNNKLETKDTVIKLLEKVGQDVAHPAIALFLSSADQQPEKKEEEKYKFDIFHHGSIDVYATHHNESGTCTYIVKEKDGKHAVVIDPVTDFDDRNHKCSWEHAKFVVDFINNNDLEIDVILETHIHADHITGSQYYKKNIKKGKRQITINAQVEVVLDVFGGLFNEKYDIKNFDILLNEGDELTFGSSKLKVIATPGHTPVCTSFSINDCLFTGDTIFHPTIGTARCDFPKGSASDLYNSIFEKLLKYPDDYTIYVGHDYPGTKRAVCFGLTVKEQRETNKHLKDNPSKAEYMKIRETRDAQLNAPKLLMQSLYLNVRAGKQPEPENNGKSYLKIPLA